MTRRTIGALVVLVGWVVWLAEPVAWSTPSLPVDAGVSNSSTADAGSNGRPFSTAPSLGGWVRVNVGDLDIDVPSSPVVTAATKVDGPDVVTERRAIVENDSLRIAIQLVEWPGASWKSDASDQAAALMLNKMRDGTWSIAVKGSTRRVVAAMAGRDLLAALTSLEGGAGTYNYRIATFFADGLIYEFTAISLVESQSDQQAAHAFASIRPAGAPPPRSPPTVPNVATPSTSPAPAYGSLPSSDSHDHGPVHVRGYFRKDGTYVQPYTRRAPRR
jgi:hypothetical protein